MSTRLSKIDSALEELNKKKVILEDLVAKNIPGSVITLEKRPLISIRPECNTLAVLKHIFDSFRMDNSAYTIGLNKFEAEGFIHYETGYTKCSNMPHMHIVEDRIVIHTTKYKFWLNLNPEHHNLVKSKNTVWSKTGKTLKGYNQWNSGSTDCLDFTKLDKHTVRFHGGTTTTILKNPITKQRALKLVKGLYK